MEFEENYTLLRNLKEGDIFLTKLNNINIYVKTLGDDKHKVKDIVDGKIYEVPHGRFPVFKKINNKAEESSLNHPKG